MTRANVHRADFEYDDEDPPGFKCGAAKLGQAAGGEALAVKLDQVPGGESICPYHYEYEEEWLIVLEGAATLRTPAGEEPLERGAVVRFAPGPGGAHKLTGRGGTPARVLMFSSAREPAVAVYPDSDKIGVWPPEPGDHVMLRRADGAVDYYAGET